MRLLLDFEGNRKREGSPLTRNVGHASSFAATLALAIMIFSFALPALAAPVVAQGTTGQIISPTFKIYLLVSPGNIRQQWAQIVADNLKDLGIQVQTVAANWGTVNDRALYPSSDVMGKTYEQGGFDALFMNWIYGPDPNPYTQFHSSQFPPTGSNYYLWNNTIADMLASNITRMMNRAAQLQCVRQWQEIAYEELPSIAILYEYGVVAFRPNFNSTPFSVNYYPRWPGVEQWKFISSPLTGVTVAQTGSCPYWGLSPYHSNYYSDITGYGPIFGELSSFGLLIRSLNSTLMDPYMAYGNYTMSPDGRNWTFWVRPGIRFHNGEELDARDVVYTYRYIMTPIWNSGWYPFIAGILGGNRSVYWAGESGTPGAGKPYNRYEVHFDIPQPWAYFEQDIGGGTILPSSVLVNSSGGIPSFSAWHPDPVDTARFVWTSFITGSNRTYRYYAKNGTQYIASGPIGAGPYKWDSYNPTTETAHLTKFNGYFNRVALEFKGAFGITDYYVKHIADTNQAISSLKNNSVQVLDSHYHLGTSIPAMDPAWSRYVSYQGYEVAEIGFNMQHPIWGTGLNTPLGQMDPSRAAEAAKHVRHAFEYLVPKDSIIQNLLNGYGVPGLTTPIMRSMPGFNYAISPRDDSLSNAKTLAMDEFMLAGYTFVEPAPSVLTQIVMSPLLLPILIFTLMLLAIGVESRRRRLLRTRRDTGERPGRQRARSQPETAPWNVQTGPGSTKTPTWRTIPAPTLVTCPNCGSSVKNPDARYCAYCGAILVTGSGGGGPPVGRGKAMMPGTRCMVCNLEVKTSDPVVWCPYCRNIAHKEHMLEWLHVKDYCPICRAHLDERDL